jgi:hypothetical protein
VLGDGQPLEFAVVRRTTIEKTGYHLPLLWLDEFDVQVARQIEFGYDEGKNLDFFSVPVFLLPELKSFVPTFQSIAYCSSTIL